MRIRATSSAPAALPEVPPSPSPPPSPTPYIRRHSPNHPAPHEAAMNRTNASSVLPALASALAILALASAPTAAQRPAPPAGAGAVKPLPDSGVASYPVGGRRDGGGS